MSSRKGRGVSLYDVLGVETDATPEEIKAAWREATDRFEPGQGSAQFRLFNEAADVLLDADKRAAYDAELAGGEAEADPAATAPAATSLPATHTEVSRKAKKAPRTASSPKKPTTSSPKKPAAATAPAKQEAVASRGVPAWVIAALAVLTIAVVAVAATFAFQNRHDQQVQDAGDEATAAAGRALPAVLSYDYRHLKADRDQAVKFLSVRYRGEYTKTFDKLIESGDSTPGPAVQAKAVVKATVEDVGVVSAETGRVRLIVFLNQSTTKGSGKASLSLNRLTVSMVKSGNQWLVEDIASY